MSKSRIKTLLQIVRLLCGGITRKQTHQTAVSVQQNKGLE